MQLKDIAEEMQQRSMAARDWVFQVLRTAIIRGVLPGGMPLRQDEIFRTAQRQPHSRQGSFPPA